jgi:hypothetical protein
MERKNICGKMNSPIRLTATVMPENATARPVVLTVRSSAPSTPSRGSSSR